MQTANINQFWLATESIIIASNFIDHYVYSTETVQSASVHYIMQMLQIHITIICACYHILLIDFINERIFVVY